MFSNAYQIASRYTNPVVVSTKQVSGKVEAGAGAFVVVNEEGWIMTAAHILIPAIVLDSHRQKLTEYSQFSEAVLADGQLSPEEKQLRIAGLEYDENWYSVVSNWWSRDNLLLSDVSYDLFLDIATAKIVNPPEEMIENIPIFRSPQNPLIPGTSLCRLGYPFHKIESTFDEVTRIFSFAPGTLPIPRFPIDGIMTRNITWMGENNRQAKLLEISTPGLRGQSGGPIFDVNGQVCGLQTKTHHLPLGFDIEVVKDGQPQTDRQYLNAGLGLHVDEILAFFDARGIRYHLA